MPTSRPKPSVLLGSFSISPRIIGAAILLLAFALRLTRLTFQPLWWDEGYSLFFATRDLPTLLDRTALDIHPPLYYVTLQLWTFFAGTSDYAVRFFSVAMGVFTVPFLYAFAQRILRLISTPRASRASSQTIKVSKFGSNTLRQQVGGRSILAAFLLAIAPIEIYYSQEVRMYGMVTLLCLASTYFFILLLDTPTRPLWLAYILASAAALYTQYYAGFVLVFQLIYFLSVDRSSRSEFHGLRSWLFGWSCIALLYLPWVVYAGKKLYSYVSFKVGHEAYPVEDPLTFFARHLAAFSVGHVSNLAWLNWVAVFFIALAAVGLVQKFAMRLAPQRLPSFQISANLLIPLYLFIPLLLGYLVNLGFPFHPIRYERLLLLASPAFFLLVAFGVAAIKHPALSFAAIIVLIAVSTISLFDYYTVARYPNDDYRPIIQQMQSLAQRGDNFLAIYPWQIGYLQSYYNGAPLNIIETPSDAWAQNPTQMQNDVNGLLATSPRVWLPALQTLGRIVEDALDTELRPKNYSVFDEWFGTTRLELFQRAEDPPKSAQPLRFDSGEVQNWGVSADSAVSGQAVVRVWFDWGDIAQNKLSLRLVDAKGNIWAQDDRDIEPGTLERIGMSIPAGTPPAIYNLQLALYRNSNPRSEAISIASVNVTPNDQSNFAAIPHRAQFEFANGVKLVGYDTSDNPSRPGFDSGVTLFWQATQKQSVNYSATVQLQDTFGRTWLDASDAIARGIYGSSQWRGSELVRDPRVFTLPGDLADGPYTLVVALIDPATNARIGNAVRLTQLQVKGRPHYFGAPSPTQKTDAHIGEVAKLVGYDLDRSGKNLQVTLYWQAQGRGQIVYQVFVHIINANGKIIAQKDQIPGAGEFPTTTWVKGEYLVDGYDLPLPADAGDYQIRVGMYDPDSGIRLPVFDPAGNQIGDFVTIR